MGKLEINSYTDAKQLIEDLYEEVGKENYKTVKGFLFELSLGYTDLDDQYKYKHIDKDGGGEGGGEYVECIFQIEDKYIHTNFNYYSYDGYEYDYILDSAAFVKPVQEMTTVFVAE